MVYRIDFDKAPETEAMVAELTSTAPPRHAPPEWPAKAAAHPRS